MKAVNNLKYSIYFSISLPFYQPKLCSQIRKYLGKIEEIAFINMQSTHFIS